MYFPSFSFWRTAPLLATSSYRNITVSGDLYIVNGDTSYTTSTGKVISRSAVLAGLGENAGTFPGPIINGYKGDTFSINVYNKLSDHTMLRETTIHWHGIEQRGGTNWADGVAFVTQCPIIPNDWFPYKFPVPDQAGTFWYHSHYSTQYCDGLRGPLIIRDHKDPYLSEYDVDDDSTVIALSDWYHKKATSGRSKWDITLINGAVKPTVCVVRGKRYRFRLINMSCNAPYLFSIDGHNLTVIEVDGVLTEKYTVNQVPILAAQRFSVILDTRGHDDTKNYWIRADVPGGKGAGGTGILHYSKAGSGDPNTQPPNPFQTLNETFIVPYHHAPAPGGPSPNAPDVVNHNLLLGLGQEGFTINGFRFRPPSTDVLLQILSGVANPWDILPKGSVIPVGRDENIQLTFLSADPTPGGPHPFHLHGHTFSVVRSIGAYSYNWKNPPRRDTVSTSMFDVPSGQNIDQVTIRFKTDNPGPWIFHCHIDWHLEEGLAVVFAEDVNGTAGEQKNRPTEWNDLCPKYWKYMSSQTKRSN